MNYKFLTVLILSFIFNIAVAATENSVAEIVSISGTAFINNRKVKAGAKVSTGMEIKVQHLSDYVDIKYKNGHVIRLKGGLIRMRSVSEKKNVLLLRRGTLFNLIKKLVGDEKFEVKTNRASFGVRGTQFYITEGKTDSYLCVCEGSVVAKRGKDEVVVEKDQDLKVLDFDKLKVTAASSMMKKMGTEVFNTLK